MTDRPPSLDDHTALGAAVDLEQVMVILREDQRARWTAGDRFGVASYLKAFPDLVSDSEAVFELLYREWLLREELGEKPEFAEYTTAFPELAGRLRMQIEVHEALDSEDAWPGASLGTEDDLAADGDQDDAVVLHPALPSVPGYEIIDELGRGGMGVVYRARQIRPSRVVALKMILAGRFAAARDLSRLQNEAEAVAALDHPNIVPVLDLGEHDGLPYFTMRLITGGSLADRPAIFLDDPRAAARLVLVVAGAVHHAHERGILHRDLKPANILLDNEGQPHVTDFGLAKRIQSGVELTLPGSVLGSPAYMAPEQASGDLSRITTATDVYGLGAILYTTLTGLPPLPSGSAEEALERLRNVDPEAPSRINPRVPRSLEIICRKCLEKDPARRYPSPAALADDLRRWLAGEPIAARPVSVPTRCWLWVRRRPVQAALAASLLTAIIAGGIGVGTQWSRAEAHRRALIREQSLLLASEAKEREGRLRSQARFGLALEAIQGYFSEAAEASLHLAADRQDSRRKLFFQASEYFEKLQRSLENDSSPEGQAQLADAYARFAAISTEIGSEAEARSTHDRAIEIRRRLAVASPADVGRARDLATALMVRGLAERRWNHPEDALRLFMESRDILQGLVARFPDDERNLSELTWHLGNIAAIHRILRRNEDALRGHQQVLAIREELVRNHPSSTKYRSDRAWVMLDIGGTLASLQRLEEAAKTLDRAEEELEALHEEAPRDADVMLMLIGVLDEVATVAWQRKRPDLMLQASERKVALADELARHSPDNYRYSEILARAHAEDHRRRRLAGDTIGAHLALERSVVTYEQMVHQYPGAARLQDDFARSLLLLSNSFRVTGDPSAALPLAEKARDIRAALLRSWPGDEPCIARVAECEMVLSMVLHALGRPQDAGPPLGRAEAAVDSLSAPSSAILYNLACALSVVSGESGGSSSAASTNRAARAVATLKRAVAAGYHDANYLLADSDFDAVRNREDFQRLCRSLSFPDDPFAR